MSARDLCIMACVFCRDPLFQRWIGDLAATEGLQPAAATALFDAGGIDDDGAKAFILELCQVKSRNDLDKDPAAAARFHKLVREPFLAWKEKADGDFYIGAPGVAWEAES